MVIAHHAGQPYGRTGGAWPIANPTRAALLGPFFTVNAAFGMGLFFLIAGYFVPASFDRKGERRFLADRLIRLGVPLVFMSLVVFPVPAYLMEGHERPLVDFVAAYLRRPLVLHLWFVSYLIVLTVGYAVWRHLTDRWAWARLRPGVPSHGAIVAYTIGLAVATFLVRVAFPVDRWVDVAPLLRVEPAHVPQYATFFVLGILASRGDWLRRLPSRTSMPWFALGLAASALCYATALLHVSTRINIRVDNGGGMSLVAVVWSVLESVIAVGLSLGLLTLFRDYVNRQSALAQQLAAAVFAVYLIHVAPVVGIQWLLAGAHMPPLAKFGLVTLTAVPLSFGLAAALRELPGVARVV